MIMNERNFKNLNQRLAELRKLMQEDLSSNDIHEKIEWTISIISGIAADWNEEGYSEYLRDLSSFFGYLGPYTSDEKLYKNKLQELYADLEEKIGEMKITSPYAE